MPTELLLAILFSTIVLFELRSKIAPPRFLLMLLRAMMLLSDMERMIPILLFEALFFIIELLGELSILNPI
jgi:hypothetical protein